MAQRKASPSGKTSSGRTTPNSGAGRPGGPKISTTKAGSTRPGSKGGAATPPPNRKPGKSIVNQKQTPWGLIWTTVAIVVFAAVVVIAVVATHKSGSGSGSTTAGGQSVNAADPYRQPEVAAAKQIKGITYRVEGQHNHVTGTITYDATPPVGGNHNGFWADCTGTVYDKAIANENAVHMLEHGAIWITYNPKTLSPAGLTTLKKYVTGVNMLALSPYPNLKSPISLQAWGYQLFVSDPSDPRIAQFIGTLKLNKKTTPEFGATCSQPTFKQHPSTFGHPSDA